MSKQERPHAIVVGAGFGGLAAAVRLGARGYRVTVIDQLDAPGGRAYVRRREGFVFDSGPTVITAPQLFEELWTLCGKTLSDDVDLRPVTPFYRIRFSDGATFDYTGDARAMRDEVARFCPSDVQGYTRFVVAIEKIFRIGFEELAHVPFSTVGSMVRILPDMLKLKSFRSVYGMVSSYVRDERLRQVLSFHPLLVGGNPFTTSSIYSLIAYLERNWGVHYPIGGTGALVNGLVGLIQGLGGTLILGKSVDRIRIENGRAMGVELADGTNIDADIVVSNADSASTYLRLVAPEFRKTWKDARLTKMRYSMGLFVWYFGTRRVYGDVAHHTILLGPRYRGLLDDIFRNKVLADDFSLYLHRPTATDPTLAPEGCDGFYVLSPVPHLGSGTDWTVEGEVYRKKIESFLGATLLPALGENLVVSEIMTPKDFRDQLGSYMGAAFGLEPILTQSAYFRPHNQSEDIAGLFLVGAGTHPGAGVPGVLSSAKVLDTIVPDGRSFRSRPLPQRSADVRHDRP